MYCFLSSSSAKQTSFDAHSPRTRQSSVRRGRRLLRSHFPSPLRSCREPRLLVTEVPDRSMASQLQPFLGGRWRDRWPHRRTHRDTAGHRLRHFGWSESRGYYSRSFQTQTYNRAVLRTVFILPLDYRVEDGRFRLSARFVTILSPTYLLSCALRGIRSMVVFVL